MPARVRRRNQISLNGDLYPTRGPVTSSLIKYPTKQVFGDQNKDTHPFTSVITWTDWSGGTGLWRTNGRDQDLARYWHSLLDTSIPGRVVLPAQAELAANPSVTGSIDVIVERDDSLLVALGGGTSVRAYSVSGNSWGGQLGLLDDKATDGLQLTTGDASSTEYAVFAHHDSGGSGWSHYNGSTFTALTTDAKYLTVWDNKLWGIDDTGSIWYVSLDSTLPTTNGEEITVGKLHKPAGWVANMFVGPTPGGDAIYVAGQDGLYVFDVDHATFHPTAVQFPRHQKGGLGACTWRGDIYISAGLGVYRYTPGASIFAVGPDADQGMASNMRGDIERLIPTHNFLFALINGSSVRPLMTYNGRGWNLWTIAGIGSDVESLLPTDANGNFRMYFARSSRLVYTALDPDVVNPDEVTRNYEVGALGGGSTSLYLLTSWFDAGQPEVDKTALRIRVETKDCDADDIIRVEFATNYSGTFSSDVLDITSDGVATGTFPTIGSATNEAGSNFRAIQFRISMVRGSTVTITPQLLTLTLEWRPKLPARYSHTVEVDLTGERGKTPLKLRAALVAAIESTAPVELSYRDDDGNTRNYFVDVISADGIEQTGRDERGVTKLTMVEP